MRIEKKCFKFCRRRSGKVSETFPGIMEDLKIDYMSRILIVSAKLSKIAYQLSEKGYKRVYLLGKRKSVYSTPNNTKIRCSFDKNLTLHYPESFFKLVITNLRNFNVTMIDFIPAHSYIILVFKQWERKAISKLFNNIEIYTNDHIDVKILKTYIILKKESVENNLKPRPTNIDILCYINKDEGLFIHSKILKDRLKHELGLISTVKQSLDNNMAPTVIIEYHRNLKKDKQLLEDIKEMVNNKKNVILETHSPIGSEVYLKLLQVPESNLTITYRSNEIAESDQAKNYKILPVLTYSNIPKIPSFDKNETRIGTFGFLGKQKGILEIVNLCRRLKVPALLLLGLNPLSSEKNFNRDINNLRDNLGKQMEIILCTADELNKIDLTKINIVYGNFSDEQIVYFMSKCSHIVFAHRSRLEESGTIKYAKRLNRPIFALDSFQSRLGQVYRFKKFSKETPFLVFRDSLTEATVSFLRKRINYKQFVLGVGESFLTFLDHLVFGSAPGMEIINSMKADDIMDDDGFEYLRCLLKV